MRDFFVGSLSALGVFLLAYRGYDRLDFWITFTAGVCAIGVALFPTKPSCSPQPGCVTPNQNLVGDIHDVFAIVLVTLMGFMALRFAKSAYQVKLTSAEAQGSRGRQIVRRALVGLGFLNQWPEGNKASAKGSTSPGVPLKRHRNTVYRVCAAITLICALLFLLQGATSWFDEVKQHLRVFLLLIETIAIFSFGAAWFVKGRSLLAIYQRRLLRNTSLTHYGPEQQQDVSAHGKEVQQLLAGGMSARSAAKKIGISRRRVSEIVAEIT